MPRGGAKEATATLDIVIFVPSSGGTDGGECFVSAAKPCVEQMWLHERLPVVDVPFIACAAVDVVTLSRAGEVK